MSLTQAVTPRFGEGRGGRWVEEGQAGGIGLTPAEAGQEQAGEVGLEDFGRIVGKKGVERGLLPQAVGGAGTLADQHYSGEPQRLTIAASDQIGSGLVALTGHAGAQKAHRMGFQ